MGRYYGGGLWWVHTSTPWTMPWTMDYGPMGRKGKLAVFESSNISETGEITPTKIGIHVCYIKAYYARIF